MSMSKKKIIHVIDDLGRGGAETLLVDLLPDLASEYELILVTLGENNDFELDQIICVEKISLGYSGIKDIWRTADKLRKIIERHKPDLVRSQLYWSNIVTRIACPKDIPFYFSVHATMNEDPIASYKKYFLNTLEKLTYRKRQKMIGVTQAVIDSFVKVHPRHGETFLLHNFVRDIFFQQSRDVKKQSDVLKLVSVGNLRLIKNMPYLVKALQSLPQTRFSLDIYGEGVVRSELMQLIETYQLRNIRLMGRRNDIYNVLPGYDVYLSPSTVEGFGIAVAEAMSIGLPVIISDIPVYREIGAEHALYIDPLDPESLRKVLIKISEGKINIEALGKSNKVYAESKFSKTGYLAKLKSIYQISLS
jgi:glycosyltransferase involved in cell wall biosynthesis